MVSAMTSILFALTAVALVVYGLERNHHRQVRQGNRLGNRLAGSSDVEDRDLSRLQADLRATTTHPARTRQPQPRSAHSQPAQARPAQSRPTQSHLAQPCPAGSDVTRAVPSVPARSVPARSRRTPTGIAPDLVPAPAGIALEPAPADLVPDLAPPGAVPDQPVSPRRSDQPCLSR